MMTIRKDSPSPQRIATNLLDVFDYDYRTAWHHCLRCARNSSTEQWRDAYNHAAQLIANQCYLKTARPVYA